MSKLQSLSVDQWFLAKQLKDIKKGFHLPFHFSVDCHQLLQRYQSAGKRPPITALLIKAASQLIHERPELNQACFHSWLGIQVAKLNYNAVNIPLMTEIEGKKVVTGISIEDAYKKSLLEITSEIKAKRPVSFDQIPINKIIHGPDLNIIKKIKLSFLYFIFCHFPSLYVKKRAGGISVSSLMNFSNEQAPVHMSAFGMTTLTISSCSLDSNGQLHIGVAFDHLITHGATGVEAIIHLSTILQRLIQNSLSLEL